MLKVLVSGCLGGRPVRFDGSGVDVASEIWTRWRAQGRLVHLCPELAVGFGVPRPPVEIVGGSATEALDDAGGVRVLEDSGRDVTDLLRSAADLALARARELDVALAVLVDGSPTCGTGYVYDGSFSGRTVPGRGLAAERLLRAGIPIFSQNELPQAASVLAELECRKEANRTSC